MKCYLVLGFFGVIILCTSCGTDTEQDKLEKVGEVSFSIPEEVEETVRATKPSGTLSFRDEILVEDLPSDIFLVRQIGDDIQEKELLPPPQEAYQLKIVETELQQYKEILELYQVKPTIGRLRKLRQVKDTIVLLTQPYYK